MTERKTGAKKLILFIVCTVLYVGISVCFNVSATEDKKLYVVYNKNSKAVKTSSSLFDAIDIASTSGIGAKIRLRNSDEVIFENNGSYDTYYMYDGTLFTGKTSDAVKAQTFIYESKGRHVINGLGHNVFNSYTILRGNPDSWSIEPRGGGYLYKFGYVYNGYRKASVRVNLTKLRLKPSQTNQKHNAYIYISSQNALTTADIGLYSGWAHSGNWRIFAGVGGVFTDCGEIVTATEKDGEYIPDADVNMTYEYEQGKVTITVENIVTGEIITKTFEDEKIGGDMAIISGTSYVTDITEGRPVDIRTGGYLKNIEYQDYKIYTADGTAYDFWVDSDSLNYSLMHSDDCITVETKTADDGSRREVINIFYDQDPDLPEGYDPNESPEASIATVSTGMQSEASQAASENSVVDGGNNFGWWIAGAAAAVILGGAGFLVWKKRKT